MATETTNYKLKKPSTVDVYNIKDFNDNADIIDEAVAAKADAIAANNGFVAGDGASVGTTAGGVAIGEGASTDYSGGAIGYKTTAHSGFSGGQMATATGNGAAVGANTSVHHGGAVGYGASAQNGFAGGQNAVCATNTDCIQLGTGTNSTANTLQVYDYTLMNADGTIPSTAIADGSITTDKIGDGAISYDCFNDDIQESIFYKEIDDYDSISIPGLYNVSESADETETDDLLTEESYSFLPDAIIGKENIQFAFWNRGIFYRKKINDKWANYWNRPSDIEDLKNLIIWNTETAYRVFGSCTLTCPTDEADEGTTISYEYCAIQFTPKNSYTEKIKLYITINGTVIEDYTEHSFANGAFTISYDFSGGETAYIKYALPQGAAIEDPELTEVPI